jgi:ABC-2 type transport system permease protein
VRGPRRGHRELHQDRRERAGHADAADDRLDARLRPVRPAGTVVELVRGGWTGDLSAAEALGAIAKAVAWTALSVFAVRRWFRWEPRH